MNVSDKKLPLLHLALSLAMAEVHNQIATCPDVIEYADDIDELEARHQELNEWREKVATRMRAKNTEFIDHDYICY